MRLEQIQKERYEVQANSNPILKLFAYLNDYIYYYLVYKQGLKRKGD